MKTRIKNAIKALGIEDKAIYTLRELEAIAKQAGCPMIEVMRYLRNR